LIVEEGAIGGATSDHIDICLAERPPVVVFFWHLPPLSWIQRLKANNTKVLMTVGSVAMGRQAIDAGCDGLIVQGSEAGGHNRSKLALLSLIPAMRDALPDTVLIAAGGIADGRGTAAALLLGADAVCVGTRLIASTEAQAHPIYKERVVAAGDDDIGLTSIFGPEWPDQPMRVLRNRVVRSWEGRDDKTPTGVHTEDQIGQTTMFGQAYPMPKFSAVLPTTATTGDFEEMCLAAGESAVLVREVQPAAEIVRSMLREAERLLSTRPDELLGLQAKPLS
jgi:enoyl-[acyl-carrier protein] reductase II